MRLWLSGLLAMTLAAGSFEQDLEQWRQRRLASLRAESGWLTVAGLFWLKPGANRFPEIQAPVEFAYQQGQVRARIGAGPWRVLRDDLPGPPDLLTQGGLTMFVIERGGRHAIRLRDRDSRYRREFKGLHYYPPAPSCRVEADFVPHPSPRKLLISTVLADLKEEMTSPGIVRFRLNGHPASLEPVREGDQLFFIFKDKTAGKTTYPAGRFLYAALPKDGKVILDFNRAYNPPCAFTPYATCPLPPRQNHLDVAIEAGELAYHLE